MTELEIPVAEVTYIVPEEVTYKLQRAPGISFLFTFNSGEGTDLVSLSQPALSNRTSN